MSSSGLSGLRARQLVEITKKDDAMTSYQLSINSYGSPLTSSDSL